MKVRAAILSQTVLAVVLALSIQVCCCHTGFLAGLFGGGADGAPVEAACCAMCADSSPTDAPEDPKPLPECTICCVKGSGLKDVTPLPPLTLAFIAAQPVTVQVPTESERHVHAIIASTGPPRPAGTSLLRLHCALIV